ncbi:MAG TPA: 3-methyl-2-oxobutanoate dehydrogenase subunit beta, partial [Deltaproteobacteria bacterium]|nr:3-methyl-2-oxobutanoate dehydrogenase subunit beta [Deltaproteobacteria bacterium]
LAPASVQEMCDLTIKAFEMAFKYRNPVVVLADAVLGQMMEFLQLPKMESPRPETSSWAVHGDADTRGNLVSSIYLDNELQERHNWMLQEKYASMEADALSESYKTGDAEIVLTGYGTCSRIARSAVDELRSQGVKAGLFRPLTLFPFPAKALNKAAKAGKLLAVELSNGQYRDDVLLHLDRKIDCDVELINRMGGNMMKVEDVVLRAREMLEVRE